MPENTHLYHIIVMIMYLFTPSYAQHKLVRSNAMPLQFSGSAAAHCLQTRKHRVTYFFAPLITSSQFPAFYVQGTLVGYKYDGAAVAARSAVRISRVPNQ